MKFNLPSIKPNPGSRCIIAFKNPNKQTAVAYYNDNGKSFDLSGCCANPIKLNRVQYWMDFPIHPDKIRKANQVKGVGYD